MRIDKQLARFKRPSEEFRLYWDFANDLEAADTYGSHVITARDVTADVDVTATFLEAPGRVGTTGAVLGVQIQGGTALHDYDVAFQLTTSQGDIFVRVVRVQVRA